MCFLAVHEPEAIPLLSKMHRLPSNRTPANVRPAIAQMRPSPGITGGSASAGAKGDLHERRATWQCSTSKACWFCISLLLKLSSFRLKLAHQHFLQSNRKSRIVPPGPWSHPQPNRIISLYIGGDPSFAPSLPCVSLPAGNDCFGVMACASATLSL